MRLELLPGSRVLVDLQATGLLRAVGHDPTLVARPGTVIFDLPGGAGDVTLTFPVRDIEAPADIPASDRDKMLEHLRGPEVLDATRYPAVTLRARFDGDLEGGTLDGTLSVRGACRHVRLRMKGVRRDDDGDGAVVVATGEWQGTLTDLGIRPFKALLGALKLKDWVRLRVEARLRPLD